MWDPEAAVDGLPSCGARGLVIDFGWMRRGVHDVIPRIAPGASPIGLRFIDHRPQGIIWWEHCASGEVHEPVGCLEGLPVIGDAKRLPLMGLPSCGYAVEGLPDWGCQEAAVEGLPVMGGCQEAAVDGLPVMGSCCSHTSPLRITRGVELRMRACLMVEGHMCVVCHLRCSLIAVRRTGWYLNRLGAW